RCVGSGAVDSWSFGGRREKFPLAGCNGSSWFWIFDRTMDCVGRTEGARILRGHQSQQFVRLFIDGCPCCASGGRDCGVAVGGHHFPAASTDRGAADCGGCHRLVLAFYGGAVALCLCSPGVCAIGSEPNAPE